MLRDTSNNSSKHPKEVTNCLRHIIHGVIYRVEVAPADEAKPKKRRELCMTRKAIKAREKRRRLKEAKEKEKELSQIYNPVVVTQYLTEDGSNAVQEAADEPIKPSPLLQQQQQVNGNDDNDDANKRPDTQAQQEQEETLVDENEMSGLIKPEDNNAVAVAADNSSFYSFLTKTDDRDDSAAQSQPTPEDVVATRSEGISNSDGNPNADVKSDDNTRIPEAMHTKEAHEE